MLKFDIKKEFSLDSATSAVNTNAGLALINLDRDYDEKLKLQRSFFIVTNRNVCQGQPTIRDTRISVANIVEFSKILGWGVDQIREQYPHLTGEQIRSALSYYESNKHEIDMFLQEEKEDEE